MNNPFEKAEGQRVKIVNAQKKEIKKLYKEANDEIKKEVKKLKGKKDVSSAKRKVELKSLSKEIEGYLKTVDDKTKKMINSNVDKMVLGVLEDNQNFIDNLGFDFYVKNSVIKNDVVKRIMSGSLYNGKWSLSKAIWGDSQEKIKEINRVVSGGILKGKSTYEIAKDLEKYVNPNVKKGYNWSREHPAVRKEIDYNAQRLARTMVSHAYEESFVRVTKNNPFIDAYRWITSGGHNVCALCLDRELSDRFGLGPGIFPKDQLPLDHPNGMCTFELVISMSDIEIADAIADWYLGEGNKELNKRIDFFVNDLKNI